MKESNFSTSDNIRSARQRGGEGCLLRSGNNTVHNPPPAKGSRGERRHAKRSDAAKKHAEAGWLIERSTRKSRYEKILGGSKR